MVNVLNLKRCGHPDCNKKASFGVAGSKTAKFCSPHKKEDMVDVKNIRRKRCGHSDCNEQASFGVAGSKTAEFCRQHKEDDMMYVKNNYEKRCNHPECDKKPSYGIEGSKRVEFCSPHAKEGMVNALAKKKCGHPGCNKAPSCGVEGSRTAEFCAGHAKEGMVNIVKSCTHPSCNKYPSFGVAGSKRAEFCSPHAQEGVVNTRTGKFFAGTNSRPGDIDGQRDSLVGRVGEGMKRKGRGAPLPPQAKASLANKHAKRTSDPSPVKEEERGVLVSGAAEAVRRTTGGNKTRHGKGQAPKLRR
eukprot:g7486.t1